jgi:CBS domain-containing protein
MGAYPAAIGNGLGGGKKKMTTARIVDLMIPLSDYAIVHENATLYDAVVALEQSQARFTSRRYSHRAILVQNDDGVIVGKLSMRDIIRGLEPGYGEITDSKMAHFGFSASFIKSIVKSQGLWQRPLDNLCEKAANIKAKDVMYTPAEGEYVEQSASLNEAIHQLIMGHHQSLLVTSQGRVTGILRLTDVFSEISSLIVGCKG